MAYEIDLLRDELFDELGKTRLKESYMKEDEESPQTEKSETRRRIKTGGRRGQSRGEARGGPARRGS